MNAGRRWTVRPVMGRVRIDERRGMVSRTIRENVPSDRPVRLIADDDGSIEEIVRALTRWWPIVSLGGDSGNVDVLRWNALRPCSTPPRHEWFTQAASVRCRVIRAADDRPDARGVCRAGRPSRTSSVGHAGADASAGVAGRGGASGARWRPAARVGVPSAFARGSGGTPARSGRGGCGGAGGRSKPDVGASGRAPAAGDGPRRPSCSRTRGTQSHGGWTSGGARRAGRGGAGGDRA